MTILKGAALTINGGSVIQSRDAMGRMIAYTEKDGTDAVVYSRSDIRYDSNSMMTRETTSAKQSGGGVVTSTTYYEYTDQTTPSIYLGVVTHVYTTDTTRVGGSGAAPTNTDTKTSYIWRDGALQSQTVFAPNSAAMSTTNHSDFVYDVNGRIQKVEIYDGRRRTINYGSDSNGQITYRQESYPLGEAAPTDRYYYFNGIRIADVSNNGTSNTDYAATIAQRSMAQGGGAFRNGAATGTVYADFDQNYDAINALSSASTAGNYVVRDGDTLQAIAQSVWGDASLWYILADANGMTGSETLVGGMTLAIPNKVVNVHNNSDTFRPYDPNKALGDTSPTQPAPPKQNLGGCGVVGMIIMVIVAVVVTIYTAGAASAAIYAALGTTAAAASAATVVAVGLASAAIGGAVGSIASQAVGIAIGAQDKFSWNAVGISALSAMVTQGLGGWSPTSNAMANAAIRGATASTITQGVAVATGMQSKFDWTSVAVAGVSAGVGDWAGTQLGDTNIGWLQNGTVGNDLAASFAGGAVGAASRSLVEGSNFGDNLMRAIPDIIGQTIGNKITGKTRWGIDAGSLKGRGGQGDGDDLMASMVADAERMARSEGSASSQFSQSLSNFDGAPSLMNGGGIYGGAIAGGDSQLGTSLLRGLSGRVGSVTGGAVDPLGTPWMEFTTWNDAIDAKIYTKEQAANGSWYGVATVNGVRTFLTQNPKNANEYYMGHPGAGRGDDLIEDLVVVGKRPGTRRYYGDLVPNSYLDNVKREVGVQQEVNIQHNNIVIPNYGKQYVNDWADRSKSGWRQAVAAVEKSSALRDQHYQDFKSEISNASNALDFIWAFRSRDVGESFSNDMSFLGGLWDNATAPFRGAGDTVVGRPVALATANAPHGEIGGISYDWRIPKQFVGDMVFDLATSSLAPRVSPGRVSVAAESEVAQITLNGAKGRAFEEAGIKGILSHVGLGKNTTAITKNGVTTILDAAGQPAGLVEFKDVANLSRSSQLTAQLGHALDTGQPYNLVVSPTTQRISQPLLDQIRAVNRQVGGGIYRYNPATDALTAWPK